MANILYEYFQSNSISSAVYEDGRRLQQLCQKRLSLLLELDLNQTSEATTLAAFIASLDDVSVEQIRSENLTKHEDTVIAKWTDGELPLLANFLLTASLNQGVATSVIMTALSDKVDELELLLP